MPSKLLKLNNNFAFITCDEGSFLGEKIVLSCGAKKAIGRIIGIDQEKYNIVEILSNVEGFDINGTVVERSGEGFESFLSPTLLGRKYDAVSNPIDGDSQVIPVEIQKFENPKIDPNVAEPSNYILTPVNIKLGEFCHIKTTKTEDQIEQIKNILNDLTLEKVVIVVSFLDSERVNIDELDESLIKNQLLNLSIQYHSIRDNKEILLTPEFALTTAKYFATEHGFDVLNIIVDFQCYQKLVHTQNRLRDKILDIDYFDQISPQYLSDQVFATDEGKGSVTTIIFEEV
jgi:vacuolar-type H+-ATPase subunit B/Vma2